MTNHNQITSNRPPRTGILWRLGTNVGSRDLRRIAEQRSPSWNIQPITYIGDYVGWIRQPGSEARDDLPTQNAPNPRSAIWQQIEENLHQEYTVLDAIIVNEETLNLQINHPENGVVNAELPVIATDRIQRGNAGTGRNINLPDPRRRLPNNVVDLTLSNKARTP